MCSKDVAATADQSKTATHATHKDNNFRQIFLFLLTQMLLKARFGQTLSSLEEHQSSEMMAKSVH
jgi:hypothetical protein